MIDLLEIENFQSHQLSEFEFTPGVNVIMGTSNSGKSAVIRALRWMISNQPRGDSFRSHWCKKKENTAATIVKYDGTVISRQRNSTTNKYTLAASAEDEDMSFEALRANVPEEIQTSLNLTEINIQSQFNPYFLISDTPGEVAKVLNKHTGLEIIDKVLKAATGNLLKISNKISVLTEQEEKQKKTVESYEYVDALITKKEILQSHIFAFENMMEMKENIKSTLVLIKEHEKERQDLHVILDTKSKVLAAEKLIKKYIQVEERSGELLSCCSYLETFYAGLEDKNNIIKNKSTIQQVLDLNEDRQEAILEQNELQNILSDLNNMDIVIRKQAKLIKKKPKIDLILEKHKKHIEMINRIQSIFTLSTAIQHLLNKVEERNVVIEECNKILAEIGVCPLCGGKWHG